MYTQDANVLAPAPTPTADNVLFNTSKKELFVPSSGYKTLQNRLKVNWNVGLQRDDLTLERLNTARLVIFGAPRDKFSASEVCSVKQECNKYKYISARTPLICFASVIEVS